MVDVSYGSSEHNTVQSVSDRLLILVYINGLTNGLHSITKFFGDNDFFLPVKVSTDCLYHDFLKALN